jgi:hypothetical protein
MNVVTSEMTWADRVRLEGRAEGEVDAILKVLRERFGTVPAAVEERVRAPREAEELTALLVRALRITSPDELWAIVLTHQAPGLAGANNARTAAMMVGPVSGPRDIVSS